MRSVLITEDNPPNPKYIHTVEITGYKFILPEKNGNDFDN